MTAWRTASEPFGHSEAWVLALIMIGVRTRRRSGASAQSGTHVAPVGGTARVPAAMGPEENTGA